MLRRRLEHAAKRPRTRAALRAANNILAVLTDDLLVSVAAHLSIRDLGRLSCVCRPLGPLIEVAARLLLAGKPPPARDLTPRQPGEAWLRTLWRLEAQLQMVGGATLTVDGKPLGCTFCFGPTRQCKADKLVVTQPLLADADLDNARALRGRVALCRRGAAPLMSKEQRAAAAGARALICVNVADTLTVSVNIPAMGSIPMVMVRPSDEARLLASSSVVLHTTGPVASAAAVVKLLQGPQPVDAKLSTACITRLRGLMLTSKGRFSPDGTVEVMSVGGATAILSAMRSHVSAEDVQQGGCQALHSLMRKSPEGQAAVLSAGGVKAVVAAMRAHPSVEKVQFYAIGALFNLVRNSPGGQAAVLVAGGVAAVVAAMGTHQMAEMLQIGAMGALFHFSRARELGCMEALARGGAAAAVRASMEALPQDTRIQRLGVMLLAQLPDNEPPPPPHPPALPALQQGDS